MLVLVAGAILRFSYYDSRHAQSDEQITVEVVRHMRHSGDWDVNWIKANVSEDLKYNQYNFSSHLYATYFFYRLAKLVPGIEDWRAEREGVLVYRFFVAALATLAVCQALQLGRRAGGWLAGLGAMALAAVAPLLVQDAHYIRPEPFTTVLMLAAIALCWPRENLQRWRPIAAALCLGLLVACKISMLLVVWLPLVPLLAAWRQTSAREWGTAWASLGALIVGFVAGAPGAVLHPAAFAHGIRHLATQYAGLHPPHSHLAGGPTGDMMVNYFAATLGWPVLALGLLGVVLLAVRRRWAELVLLTGPVVCFGGYFATRSVFFERNLSHVLPLLLILAGCGLAWVVERLPGRVQLPVALAALALMVLRPAALSSDLLRVEYSGLGGERFRAHEEAVRTRHADADWRAELLLTDEPLAALEAHFRTGGRPVLCKVTDFRDEWTAANLAGLHARFTADEVAIWAGTFPSLPTCTLLTYHSPTDRYVLVKGLKTR